jgi:hypothetical protein
MKPSRGQHHHITAVVLFLSAATTTATKNVSVGINEPWTMQYMLQANVSCPDCPTNEQPRSLEEIECRLSDLAANQSVRVFREILPFRLLQPEPAFDDPANANARRLAAEVLSLYARYNASVILAFDCPLAYWMTESPWCPIPMPEDTEGWAQLKDKLALAMANFVAWLAAPASSSDGGGGSGGGGLDAEWLATQFLLEPWNEFDAKAGADCIWPSAAPSPDRAAELQAAVAAALASTGAFSGSGGGASRLPTQLTPSVSGAQGSWSDYIAAYYASGGGGLPSIHWYGCDVQGLEAAVNAVEAVLPAAYKGQQVMGETGCALGTTTDDGGGDDDGGGGGCSAGPSTVGTEDDRTAFLEGIATSTTLAAACRHVLFWRVMDLADGGGGGPPVGCEGTFGITTQDNSAYDAAGSNFFRVVGGSGTSKACVVAGGR